MLNQDLWRQRFGEHLELKGRTRRTVESYTEEVTRFFEFLEDTGVERLADITLEVLQEYRLELHRHRQANGRPLALGTQSNRLTIIVMFMRYLYRSRFIVLDPSAGIERPRVPEVLPLDLPSEEEVLRVLTAPDTTTPLGLRDRAALETLYSSAIRNTELRSLLLDDVDLARRELRIRCGKGGKPRVVPLGDEACAWLEEYFRNGRPWLVRESCQRIVFLSARGRPFSREALSTVVRRATELSGVLKRVTPHTLRHCCATHMLRNRAGLRHLQQLLGHASASSTQRYTRVEISDLRSVHQRCHPRESF